jgi:hypothetical protein
MMLEKLPHYICKTSTYSSSTDNENNKNDDFEEIIIQLHEAAPVDIVLWTIDAHQHYGHE